MGDLSKRREIVFLSRLSSDASEIGDIARAASHEGKLLLMDKVPHRSPVRIRGIAIIQHDS